MGGSSLLDRAAKEAWRDELAGAFDKAGAIFVANYSGMTVEELTEVRRGLRGANAQFKIVKNTVARKAISGKDSEGVGSLLKGQTGVVFAFGDAAAAAKAFTEFAKKSEKLKVVGGYMDKQTLDSKSIEALASLPSREVLISKILGSLTAPHRGLMGVLQALPRNMVNVLDQIAKQKQEAAPEA